jgi:GlpG protein
MRLIWSTEQLDLFKKFCRLLEKKSIPFQVEEKKVSDWGQEDFGKISLSLWILEEDDIEKAATLLEQFQKNPLEYEEPEPSPEVTEEQFLEEPKPRKESEILRKFQISLTHFFIVLCSALWLMTLWTEKDQDRIPKQVQPYILTTSPLEKALLFDYPKHFELVDKITTIWGYEALLKPQDLPPPGKFLYASWQNTPYWEGVYSLFIKGGENKGAEAPLFERIQEGEIWRLVTPILLHGDILHLFFNMIWLLILGTQLESRLGSLRFLLFIIIAAAISNVSQYLVSGPAFIGYSGVVCAMAFFIHRRQRSAPWEGYIMSEGTFQFIMFFIVALFLLSCTAFILDFFQLPSFPMVIANSAHMVGALSGDLLGRLHFFSWRHFSE